MQRGKVPILHLAMSLGIGGAETHVVGLAVALKKRSWPVYVGSNGGERVRDLIESGVHHLTIPLHSRWPSHMARSYRLLSSTIDEYSVGLVHAHARIPAFIAGHVCGKKGIPLITTYHGAYAPGFPWNLVTKPGNLTVTVSDDIKEHVIRHFGFPEDRITIIPNGIDTDTYHPPSLEEASWAKERFGVEEGEGPVITYVSRLDEDLEETALAVLEAFRLVRKEFCRAVLLVAGDGDRAGRVRSRAWEINRLCGRDAVRPLGFVVDTPLLFAASDLVIGMSRVALEAMATAKPVLIAGPGGLFGPVDEGTLNSLEERNFTSRDAPVPLDVRLLADQVKRLLLDPALLGRLGRLGRETVVKDHSLSKVARDHEILYDRVLGGDRYGHFG